MNYKNLQTESFEGDGFRITLNKRGENTHVKQRRPVKYGLYSEIETESALLQFNLNDEIIRAEGRGTTWPSDLEYLKRTAGNDWVYYSTGGYAGSWETLTDGSFRAPVSFRIPEPYSEVYKTIGEYYLPNLPYESNTILGGDPLSLPAVRGLADGWFDTIAPLLDASPDMPARFRRFLSRAAQNSPDRLERKAEQLFAACGGRASVIPPDARHVDYDVIPLNISQGCLYKCRFCTVKNTAPFSNRSRADIEEQIEHLTSLYARDLANYNSLFLGDHDALNADDDLIFFAIAEARHRLGQSRSYMRGSNVFLFGSVTSLMNKDDSFFDRLNACGCDVYINVGLESADQETLDFIGKPLKSAEVVRCFERMQSLNQKHDRIECSSNFVFDEALPAGHIPAFLDLAKGVKDFPRDKGTIYLSPLCISRPSPRTLFEFKQLKTFSFQPVYLYLIQRI
jgi:hypothetical protein